MDRSGTLAHISRKRPGEGESLPYRHNTGNKRRFPSIAGKGIPLFLTPVAGGFFVWETLLRFRPLRCFRPRASPKPPVFPGRLNLALGIDRTPARRTKLDETGFLMR